MTRLELRENGDWMLAPFDAVTIDAACSTGLIESRITPLGVHVKPLLNRIGSVSVGMNEFVVQPKAPFSSVLFMLGYANDPGFRPGEVAGAGGDIFPAIAETCARLMERALGRGVLQGYRSYDESAVTVRGRIRFSDQISKRGGQLLPIELTVEEFTVDIVENQILRHTVRLLLTLPRVSNDVRRRLLHLESRLSDASLVRPGTGLPTWHPSRLNQRYHSALRFAEMVVAHLAPSTTGDGERIASFVVNMSEAFEGFVTAGLTSAFAEVSAGVSVGQYPTHLDVERRQPIRPDFVHVVGGVPAVVADAKYKTGSPRVEDLYQMLAYCTVLGLRAGTLIYVADGEDTRERVASVHGSDVVVRTARLDVSLAPPHMIGALRQIQVRMLGARDPNHTLRGDPAPDRAGQY